MDSSLAEIYRLLAEVTDHLASSAKRDKSAAVSKLERVVALASTLAFTIEASRR